MIFLSHDQCYAYSRVSTTIQQEGEQALDRQDAWLRDGGDTGFKAKGIYSEIGSARGSHDQDKRPQFRQAWDEAHRDGVPLMVTSASRLSRNLQHLKQLMKTKPVRVIILDQGGLVTQDELFRLVEIAEENGRKIAADASVYANRRIQQGLPHGCAASTKKAGIASGKVRAQKAHDKREELIRFFRSRPNLMELSLTDMLNALNSASIKTASGNHWTYSSASKLLPAIMREIDEICAMEAEVDAEEFDAGERVSSPDSKKHLGRRTAKKIAGASARSPGSRTSRIESDASHPERRAIAKEGAGCEILLREFTWKNPFGDLELSSATGGSDASALGSYKIIPWLTAEIQGFDSGEPSLSADLPTPACIGRHFCYRLPCQSPGAGLQRALSVLEVERRPARLEALCGLPRRHLILGTAQAPFTILAAQPACRRDQSHMLQCRRSMVGSRGARPLDRRVRTR